MGKDGASREDLEILSAEAHTYESFGRSVISAALAAAAAEAGGPIEPGRIVKLHPSVTITTFGGFVLTCVEIPPFGRFCKLQRPGED